MKFNKMMLTTAISTVMLSASVSADTTLTFNNADGQENSKMYLSNGLAKVTNDTDVDTAIIFNTQKNAFTVVNHEEKSYMVMGEKEIAALGDMAGMIDRMLDEQLAQMPEAQREQMRGMMRGMIEKQMPKQAALPQYKKTGESSSYNGFDCEVVVQTVDGKKQGDLCVAGLDDLGVAPADYVAIQEFMKIADKLAGQFGQSQGVNFAAVGDVLPVYYQMGSEKAYLTDVNNNSIGAETFQIPAGYKEQSLPKEMFR